MAIDHHNPDPFGLEYPVDPRIDLQRRGEERIDWRRAAASSVSDLTMLLSFPIKDFGIELGDFRRQLDGGVPLRTQLGVENLVEHLSGELRPVRPSRELAQCPHLPIARRGSKKAL